MLFRCKFCQSLAPEWAELAKQFTSQRSSLAVASVNCVASPSLCSLYDVNTFYVQTLFVFFSIILYRTEFVTHQRLPQPRNKWVWSHGRQANPLGTALTCPTQSVGLWLYFPPKSVEMVTWNTCVQMNENVSLLASE